MLRARKDSPSGENGRSGQIEKIISSVLHRENAGLSRNDAEIERRYPELMPELGERLRTARTIQAAAEKAKQEPPPLGPGEDRCALLEDHLEWFGESLAAFQILERIDYGGQGAVYKAVQKATNRIVAIKILLDGPLSSPRQRDRFAREVDLISKLRHPNIVTLFESGAVQGRPFFAMEYVDGLPIDDRMLLDRPPVDECVRMFSKVCRAVSHAHQRGIIHRDLKPGNILVDEDDEPHVLDFGLAKSIEDAYGDEEKPPLSMAGQVFGTLPYLSPEQACGSPDQTDVRSDIYALGVILHRLLTGVFPYPVEGDRETVRTNILTREPLSLRQAMSNSGFDIRTTTGRITHDLEQIVLKALAKDKSRRYQSAAAFADDLDRYLAGEAVHAKADSSLYVLRKMVSRYRVHFAVAGAFLILLLGALAGMTVLWQRAEGSRERAERVAKIAQAGLQMGSYLKLGSVERDEGRVEEAIAMFEGAIQIAESTPTSDPVVQRHLYAAHHRLAELYCAALDTQKFARHCNVAVQIAEDCASHFPGDLEWRRQLSFSYELRGRMASSHREWDRAREDLQHAASIHEELAAINPENRRHKYDLGFVRNLQGRCYRKLERFSESLHCYTEAHSIFSALVEAEPGSLDYAIGLTRTETKLAAWHITQRTRDHDEKALQRLDAAADRLSGLDASGKLSARRRDADQLWETIQTNRQIIAKRAAKRGKTS